MISTRLASIFISPLSMSRYSETSFDSMCGLRGKSDTPIILPLCLNLRRACARVKPQV
jgi:hypothetical protein